MSYVVAYFDGKRGSIVWPYPADFQMTEYFSKMDQKYWNTPIEFVLIGRLDIYREYEPFQLADTKEAFEVAIQQQLEGKESTLPVVSIVDAYFSDVAEGEDYQPLEWKDERKDTSKTKKQLSELNVDSSSLDESFIEALNEGLKKYEKALRNLAQRREGAYYLIGQHDHKETVIIIEEQKIERLIRFMRYLDYTYEEKDISFSLVGGQDLNEFTGLIYVTNEDEFIERIEEME